MRLAWPISSRLINLVPILALAIAIFLSSNEGLISSVQAEYDPSEDQRMDGVEHSGYIFRLDGNPSRIFKPEAVWDTVTGLIGLELDPRFEGDSGTSIVTSLEAPTRQGAGGALVPFRDPAPAFSRNILVTRDFSNSPVQTEPHIAVNPNDPDHLVIGAIDFNFPTVVAYVTFDAGENWEGPFQTPYLRDDITGAGDPVVGFDRDGNVYILSISLGLEEFTVGNTIGLAAVSSIQIAKSRDGGFNWEDPIPTSRSIVDTNLTLDQNLRARGSVDVSFLDKPWIAVGPDPENPGSDIIYVTYIRFNVINTVLYSDELPLLSSGEVQSTVQLVHSSDGGTTWSDPIDVSPTVRRVAGDAPVPGAANAVGLKRVVQGASPHVGPDGTVYVTWLDSTDDESQEGLAEIYIARSDDGQSFNDPIRTVVMREVGFTPRTASFRYWASAFPQTAVGPDGAINIVYVGLNSSAPVDDGDVYFIRSEDHGETWSRPATLGGDRGTGLQFFPAIDVDNEGDIHVMWGDMRDSPEQARYHIYYTQSEDNGKTWGFVDDRLNIRSPDARVTDFPSNPNKGFPQGQFIGDYFSIAAGDNDVFLVWPDTRLGEFGPFNQKIGFARPQAIPAHEIIITPPAGPGGQQVTVQGFNLQPDLNIFIQAGGVTIATERTNAKARFTTPLFMPVSSEGAQNVRVLDESGNVAIASYFTEFGFGDIQEETQALAERLDVLFGGEQFAALTQLQAQRAVDGASAAGTTWWIILVAALGGAIVGSLIASGLISRS